MNESDRQKMLCLAALSYRSYADWTPGTVRDARLRETIENGLKDPRLPLLENQWSLVWGPESYRAPLSLVDDSMMFVAREVGGAKRYAVVVRGTNPISAFDWVLGDLWVGMQVPWEQTEDDGSALSMSTALGLEMLIHMKSAEPDSSAGLWKLLDRLAGRVEDVIEDLTDLDEIRNAARNLSERLSGGAQRFGGLFGDNEELAEVSSASIVDSVKAAAISFSEVGDLIAQKGKKGLYASLRREIRVSSEESDGHTLMTFLRGAMDAEASAEIIVTGHSKGGALAPALALWLEETRSGSRHGVRDGWDPDGRATVGCVSFAGPTPGNQAFAERFNGKLGGRYDRVFSKLDVVPRAWEPEALKKVRDLYEPTPRCPGPLADAIDLMAESVDGLEYAHLGGSWHALEPKLNSRRKVFLAQVIHQHLEGYFEAMDLPLKTLDFFGPNEDPVPLAPDRSAEPVIVLPQVGTSDRTESVESPLLDIPSPRDVTGRESPSHDAVQFEAFAANFVTPASFTVDVWAFLDGDRDRVLKASQSWGRDKSVGAKYGSIIHRESVIEIEVSAHGAEVDNPVDTIIWNGEPSNASFRMVAHKGRVEPVIGIAKVSVAGIRIASLSFEIPLEKSRDTRRVSNSLEHVRTAFASYSSANRADVLSRIQGMQKIAPELDVFVDIDALRSGADWPAKLAEQVPSRDTFFLFWSDAASTSEWVEREWRLALRERGLRYIDPVPIEDPSLVPPPPLLGKLNFADKWMRYIKYEKMLGTPLERGD